MSGELSIEEFVSLDKRQKAMELIKNGPETGSIFEMLSSFMDYTEVKMMLAWLRSGKK